MALVPFCQCSTRSIGVFPAWAETEEEFDFQVEGVYKFTSCVCVCVFNEVMARYMLLRCFMFPTMICSLFSNQSFTVSHRDAFGISN